MFDIKSYKKFLNSRYLGKNILYFDNLASTNSKAIELSVENVPNGTVIITDHQTSGRGRQSNKWISTPGKSLTFSVIIYPNKNINELNKYPLIAGLAIVDILTELEIIPQLKWPNDVLINKKKVCGILCESKLSGRTIKSMVIGIGLNINEGQSDIKKEINKSATSLKLELGIELQIEQLLTILLKYLESRLDQIDENEKIIDEWKKHCIHLNHNIIFKDSKGDNRGVFVGLSSQGQAIININNKELIFNNGEISYIGFK